LLFAQFTVGWIPGYLVFNFTGPAKYRGKNASHFSPDAVFVQPNERHLIVQSNIAFGTALALLAYCGVVYGWINVLRMYFVPYLIVNFHLVLITYLQV
jgi:omega-6 fatty acid desaturase (delta-12 desaturase)